MAPMAAGGNDDGGADGDDASWADPLWWTPHTGRFELRAQLTHDGQRSDCSRWTERALLSFREGQETRQRSLALLRCITSMVLASSFWSLMPILCPFGDPYDLSARGFVLNSGYFFAYSGLGWGSLWLTNSLWTVRILGLSSVRAVWTVVLPTVAAVVLCEHFSCALLLSCRPHAPASLTALHCCPQSLARTWVSGGPLRWVRSWWAARASSFTGCAYGAS